MSDDYPDDLSALDDDAVLALLASVAPRLAEAQKLTQDLLSYRKRLWVEGAERQPRIPEAALASASGVTRSLLSNTLTQLRKKATAATD